MSFIDVPSEFIHCFNVTDEIPTPDRMDVEESQQADLYETVTLEWQAWQPGVGDQVQKKPEEPEIKRIMNLDMYEANSNQTQVAEENIVPVVVPEQKNISKKQKPVSSKAAPGLRGPYRSYTPTQIQELLDLVIEQSMSARQAGLTVGIVVRTAQHYVKQYKDDEQKRLPGKRNPRYGYSKKLGSRHTDFLCDFYTENATAVLWQARDALLSNFSDIESISLSSLHDHLVNHASLTLKKLEPVISSRTSQETLNKRRLKVLEWKSDESMDWKSNCVFIDEAGFNMHIRRNFGRSKIGTPAKDVLPANRGITITIIGAICEKGVIDLTLRKPKPVPKRDSSNKKRKRNGGKASEVVDLNARVGTRSEYFLQFISGVMDTLDSHKMNGRYLIMDNASIHKVSEVSELIVTRGYKPVYLPPYSPFLNPIELFWSKVKAGVKRDCLSSTDNLSSRIMESAKQVTIDDCRGWIKHSVSFFDRCLALEPML